MFFDTHVHFDAARGLDDAVRGIERARAAGVSRLLAVGGTPALNRIAAEAAGRCAPDVQAAVGYERDEAPRLAREGLERGVAELEAGIRGLAAGGVRVAAVGEIGLDVHYSQGTAGDQVALLRAELAMARRQGRPVVVHSREADEATLGELRAHAAARGGPPAGAGVIHCFTGGEGFARAAMDLGFYISFSGIVTFPKAGALRAVARTLPEERLLIETDAPYLAPVPHRGERNEPAWLPHVAETLARVRGCSVERIAAVTRDNAERLFGASAGPETAGRLRGVEA